MNDSIQIKFIVDNDKKTITFYFSEKTLREVAKICVEKKIPIERATEILTGKLIDTTEMAEYVIGKNLQDYSSTIASWRA